MMAKGTIVQQAGGVRVNSWICAKPAPTNTGKHTEWPIASLRYGRAPNYARGSEGNRRISSTSWVVLKGLNETESGWKKLCFAGWCRRHNSASPTRMQ